MQLSVSVASHFTVPALCHSGQRRECRFKTQFLSLKRYSRKAAHPDELLRASALYDTRDEFHACSAGGQYDASSFKIIQLTASSQTLCFK